MTKGEGTLSGSEEKIIKYARWSPSEDEIVINTVIEAIKNGEPQQSALRRVAEQLHRTSEAAEWRWNTKLRKSMSHFLENARGDKQKLYPSRYHVSKVPDAPNNPEPQTIPMPSHRKIEDILLDIEVLVASLNQKVTILLEEKSRV